MTDQNFKRERVSRRLSDYFHYLSEFSCQFYSLDWCDIIATVGHMM